MAGVIFGEVGVSFFLASAVFGEFATQNASRLRERKRDGSRTDVDEICGSWLDHILGLVFFSLEDFTNSGLKS